jgi:nucleoside-diphosphate-sugar epimerase
MRILVLGATGYLGGGLTARFVADGHEVLGLARKPEAAATLAAKGMRPILGDLEGDLTGLLDEAGRADAVVFAPQLLIDPERRVVEAFLDRLAGTGKTFIFTSGTGVLGQLTAGDWSEDAFAEDDPFTPYKLVAGRVETENQVRAAASRGVRALVIRPPLIWGPTPHGHVALAYQAVATTGAACYVGRGLNMYSHVHIDDLARLYALALEKGVPGALYHAVAGEAANRWIAESVARDLGVEARSVSMDEAIDIWGKFVTLIMLGVSSRSRSPRARRELSWSPTQLNILDQVGQPQFRALAKSAPLTQAR